MMPSPPLPGAEAAAREPWGVLVPLSLVGFLLIGAMLTSLSIYTVVMQAQFGWSATALGAGPVALLVGMSAGNLFVSPAMRRFGLPGSFAFGCALAGVAWAAAGLSATLVQFVTAMALAGLGAGMATIVPGIALLTQAFHLRRGLAIALFIGSCSLASATMPLATNLLIERIGWRATFWIVGGAALVLAPALWRFLPPAAPEASAPRSSTDAPHLSGLERGQALRLPAFWVLTLVLTLSQLCMNGVLFNIVAHLQDRGVPSARAVELYSVTNFMSLPGLLIGGYVSDRVPARVLFPLIILAQAGGTLALVGVGMPGVWGAIVTAAFVLVWGGVAGLPAQAGSLLLRDIVGGAQFAALLGIVFTVNGFVGALAPGLTGWLRDAAGDYRDAFILFAGLLAAASVGALWCRVQPKPAISGEG